MLAAVPLLLSLVSANVIPVAKRDEDSIIQRDAGVESYKREEFSIGSDLTDEVGDGLSVGVSKRESFSIGSTLTDEISDAINALVHIPGVDNGNLLSDVVSVINKGLNDLKVGIEQLNPTEIGQLIEKAVGEVSSKLGSVFDGGLGAELIDTLKDTIGSSLGISIN